MKNFITAVSIMFLILAGSGLAFADEPAESDVTSVLDRHAVWTQWLEGDDQSILVEGATDTGPVTEKTESDVIHKASMIESDTSKFDSPKTGHAVSEID